MQRHSNPNNAPVLAFTLFIGVPLKRYRYCGKEQDEEPSKASSRTPLEKQTKGEQTGLYYYGARYYAPWLCRFSTVDPKALEYVHQSTYVFADNNPVVKYDVNGEGTNGDGTAGENQPQQFKYNGNSLIKEKEIKPNTNDYKLPTRTNFIGDKDKDYGFASKAQIEIAAKNNGKAGDMKIYWNPDARVLSGKLGDYFYQKPVQLFNEIVVNVPLALPPMRIGAPNVITIPNINFVPLAPGFTNPIATNTLLNNIGNGNLPTDVLNITGRTRQLPPVELNLGNNADGFAIMQRTISNVTPATRTATNTIINVQLSTEQPPITTGGINMNVLLNQRFNLIAGQIAAGAFPRGNVIQMPNLFNLRGLGPTGNSSRFNALTQIRRASGLIRTNTIQTRQRTYGE